MSNAIKQDSFVYFFGGGQAEGGNSLKHLVGGKGASLAEMTRAGLNVPPGFTISAECCDLYFKAARQWPFGLADEVRANLTRLEKVAGRPFGRGGDPLLVAVRSGAAHSMPGMMDTVLNVGLNPDCVQAMAERTGNRRGAWEAYRHFLVMFGHTVGGVPETVFTDLIADLLRQTGKQSEAELDAEQMEGLCHRFLAAYQRHAGRELPTEPWVLLCEAIDAVFGSWHNERAISYRRHHRIEGLLGTAVNVQMMCPAEVSGVMFTANPVNPALSQILIESSYGLGEAIVLGKVTPDRFVLDKNSLRVLERVISAKEHITFTLTRNGQDSTGARDVASLSDTQLQELGRLGLRVEAYFETPCDIEWALSGGQFYLLQARAIKGLKQAAERNGRTVTPADATPAEREAVRREEIAALAARAGRARTIWARYNLAEILPQPTPMTWAIVRRFMSGRGGYGLMSRDLGSAPHPSLNEDGTFDLICGRPYCNLRREAVLQCRHLPLGFSFQELKKAPHKAIYPRPETLAFDRSRAGWSFWVSWPLSLPAFLLTGARRRWKLASLYPRFHQRLRQELLPAWAAETAAGAEEDLSCLDEAALLNRLEHWIRRTLYDFARDSLKATALADLALENLRQALAPGLGPERARLIAGQLSMGVHPDPEADLPTAQRELATGRLDHETFLERFGHRCEAEMELAHPRWSEDPAALAQLAARQVAGTHTSVPDPRRIWRRVAVQARLLPEQRPALERELERLHTYVGLRETAKHYLLRGYALIRRVLVEMDQRHHLDGGIFFLTPEELPRLIQGEDLSGLIAQRRRRRELALGLEVPQVLFSDDLEAIGRPVEVTAATTLRGVPLSAGVAEAPALVLEHPTDQLPAEPYILVCPTTDPAWVPLFHRARGLVMETGGVLSHGAIVAREYGLPAVAGLPDVQRRLRTGQRLRIDGGTGTVTVLPVSAWP